METTKWRFLDTGKGNAFFNMALDEAILKAVGKDASPPTFRLYGWNPDAVTFGYSQDIERLINIESCKIDDVDITRRLTGGHAVFHKNEVAYSMVGSIDDPCFGGNIMDTYQSINKVLVESFNLLGINAKINCGGTEKGIPNSIRRLLPCFLITSRFEITLDGKKLVGSAQRRFNGLFLQQGSILIGPGHERIINYIKDNEMASEFKERLSDWSIDFKSKFNDNFSIVSLKKSILSVFKKTVDTGYEFEYPTQEELKHTNRLIEERYKSKGWIFGDGRRSGF